MSQTDNHIAISIIIPVFNNVEGLLLLLRSLQNQSNMNFEVIVVDDGSTENIQEIVTQFSREYPVPLQYFYLDNTDIFGAGIARNHGAKQAKGDILLFFNQDCVAGVDLIKKHMRYHKDRDVILGYYAGYSEGTRGYDHEMLNAYIEQKKALPLKTEFRDKMFDDEHPDDAWKVFVSSHFSIKRKIFEEINFDEAFIDWGCEDVELGYRLSRAGVTIYMVKDCVAYNSSQEPWCTKRKFLILLKSLAQMYGKYRNDDIKRYCLERFYHAPMKFRESLLLVFRNKEMKIINSQTQVLLDRNSVAHVMAGNDFHEMLEVIEGLAPLSRKMVFRLSAATTAGKDSLIRFRSAYRQLQGTLGIEKVSIDLGSVKLQGADLEKEMY